MKVGTLAANLEDFADFSVECRPISGIEDTAGANDELAWSFHQLRIYRQRDKVRQQVQTARKHNR